MSQIFKERVFVMLGLFLVGSGLFASTFQQTFSGVEAAQSPMFFPRIILILWLGLALLAIVQSLRAETETTPVANWFRLVLLLIASVLYTVVIGREGFFLPSMLFAAISLPIFGVRNPLIVAAYAIAVPGALVLLFNHVLSMPLPVSRFTHLF